MDRRLVLITWAKIIYETDFYSMIYNIVSRDHFVTETTLFYYLNVNYDNGKCVYEQ